MFINDNKQKIVTLSVRHLLSNIEIESACVMNVVSKKSPRYINYLIRNMSDLSGGVHICMQITIFKYKLIDPAKWPSKLKRVKQVNTQKKKIKKCSFMKFAHITVPPSLHQRCSSNKSRLSTPLPFQVKYSRSF